MTIDKWNFDTIYCGLSAVQTAYLNGKLSIDDVTNAYCSFLQHIIDNNIVSQNEAFDYLKAIYAEVKKDIEKGTNQ